MLITSPGPIADRLYLLGTRQNIVYLVKGKESMLIGGAMNWVAPELERQFRDYDIDTESIKYIVIQHSHFDHCGLVPYLKRKLPQVSVLGTESAKKILAKEKVINYVELVNKTMLDYYRLQEEYRRMNLIIDKIEVDTTVNDSTVVDLGDGLDVHFIETPGHSPCAVAVYIPSLKALFPTDSAPCPFDDIQTLARPSPQYDFNLYRQSLRKLAGYEIDICGFDHFAAVVGDDARQVLRNGLTQCDEHEQYILKMYDEAGDLETVARRVARMPIIIEESGIMTGDVMVPVARAEVRNILKAAGRL